MAFSGCGAVSYCRRCKALQSRSAQFHFLRLFSAVPLWTVLLISIAVVLLTSRTVYAPPARISTGIVVLYDFNEGSGDLVQDIGGNGTPLDLFINDTSTISWQPSSLVINNNTLVDSIGAASKVSDAIKASNEFTIEAWIVPDTISQSGPARIVTLSPSNTERNFTLGQRNSQYDVRFRTTVTGSNGKPSLRSPRGSVTTLLTHVVYTFDANGVATIYIDGIAQGSRTISGTTDNWDSSYQLFLGSEANSDSPWLGAFYLVAIYDWAFSAVDVNQNFMAGEETGPAAPVITNIQVNATETDAVITWDTNIVADSEVAYGENTDYDDGTVSDGSFVTNHSIPIAGLNPGTTYHFQITSTTNEGSSATAPDQTFVTLGGNEPPSILVQPSSQTVNVGQSAIFSVQATGSLPLNYQWLRDSTNITGETGSSYTLADVSIADDGAQFQVVVSNVLDSVISDVAALSVTNSSRVTADQQVLYTFSEGSGPNVIDVSGIGAPLNLEIENTGSVQWGSGTLQVTGSTLIASSVAATKVIDAVKLSNEITVEAWIEAANVAQTGPARIVSVSSDLQNRNVTVGQKADAYDIRLRTTSTDLNGRPVLNVSGSVATTLSHVVYRRDSSGTARLYVNSNLMGSKTISGTMSNWDDTYRLSLANEFTGNRPWLGTYHLVAIYSRALTEAEIDQNFQAGSGGTVDETAPTISNVQVSSVGDTTVTITWDTDEPATSHVDYGLTAAYTSGTESNLLPVINHSITINNLQPDTPYHYRIRSADSANNEAISADFTFTTGPDSTPPIISNVQVVNIDESSATVTWTTDEPADSNVDYGLSTGYEIGTEIDATLENGHGVTLTNLQSAMTYHFQIRSSDVNGNEAISIDYSFETSAGPQPPSIDSQPISLTVVEGQNATFSVSASGSSPLNYQWQRNGVDINGETNSSYTLTNATQADDGAQFQVTVSNGLGAVVSDSATLTITTSTRVFTDLLALYTFEEGGGNLIQDVSGVASALPLQIADTSAVNWLSGAIQINNSTQIATLGAATKVINSIKQSNEITVEAWVVPANDTQTGPARLVTLSEDTLSRNMTFGQKVDDYNVRLRTTDTSDNGKPALNADASVTTTLSHVVYTRDANGTARIFLNNQLIANGTVTGLTSNWNDNYRLAIGNELSGERPWFGTIYLVAIYSRAITLSEIDQNFQAGIDGSGSTNQLPQASFSATPTAGNAPLNVAFDASTSSDSDGTITDYDWDFGDGNSDSGVTVNHQYVAAGQYTATLTVTDDAGGTGIFTAPITVAGGGDIPFTYINVASVPPGDPHCKATGDINGDGFPDLIVGSAQANDGLFWYEYPNWNKHTIVPPGIAGFTTDMQVADIDNDGDLDAVIPKGISKGETVWWYENPRPSGDPAVDPWIEHAIGTAGAHDLEVGDVNNDGMIDVLVRDDNTTLFIQNSPDSWTPVIVSTRPKEGISLGDIDLDNDLDIAINGYWLENPLPTGDPVVDPWPEHLVDSNWPNRVGVLIANVNSDGRPDIALAPSENEPDRFSWYEAPVDPKNGVWMEHIIDSDVGYFHTFKAGDVDLDGDIDFATAEMTQSVNPDEVSVYRNLGEGLGWQQQILATTGSHNLRLDDIDRDGDLDLFGVNWQGNTPIDMWRNELGQPKALNKWQRHVVDNGKPWRAIFIESADIDRDGLPDIVAGGWWYKNPGQNSGNWTRNTIGSPLNNMATVYDFDGDGDLDILGTEGIGGDVNPSLLWAQNDGSGNFTLLSNIDSGSGDFLQGISVGRFPASGELEVALAWHDGSGGTEKLTIPQNPETEQWVLSQLSTTTQGEELSKGDVDGDLDDDLVLGTKWLRNDGVGWTAFNLFTPNGSPDRNRLADINNDGDLDVVIGYETNPEGKLAWYEQPDTATNLWIEHIVDNNLTNPQSVDIGDMDGDGDLDIVVGEHNLSTPANSRLIVYENLDGQGGNWQAHVIHQGDEHHDGAQLVDIDLDGDLDIISIGWNHSNVLLYENKGNIVRFAIVGDYGVDNNDELAVASMIKQWRPQFIVTTGDNYYDPNPVDSAVGKYFSEFIGNYQGNFGSGSASNRFFPSIGNHDWRDGGGISDYLNYFTLPGAGIVSSDSSGNERYYDARIGEVHLFIIDSDTMEPDGISSTSLQAQWLQNQLGQSNAKWKIVVSHHPPYSSADVHGNTPALQWPFESWGASLVISGHDHTYERLDKNGFPYIVNGLGGRLRYGLGNQDPDSQVFYADNFGAMIVVDCGNSLTLQFYSISDGLIDSFTLGGARCDQAP